MRRLVQGRETIDPAESRLVELVRATDKMSVNPFRKRAILHRLETGNRRSPVLRTWTGGVAGVLLVGTATAGTVSWWRDRQPEQPVSRAAIGTEAAPPQRAPASEARIIDDGQPAVDAPAPRSTATKPSVGAHSRSKSRPGEDPTLVMHAIRALRTDHDPVRAEELLQSYMRAYPRGALSEEALALQIEAARVRHDPIAVERASRYLRLYPQGAYRKAAESALQATP